MTMQSNTASTFHMSDYAQVLREEQRRLAAERAEALVNLFALLGRNYVVYYPRLAQIVKSPKAALMLGHGIYFTRYILQSQQARDGWFYMDVADWFKATGLRMREQATARAVLKTAGVLEEKRLGMPARIWYRIKLEKLAELLNHRIDQLTKSAWPWEDAALKVLLGRTITFYAPLAWYLDNAVAAICLSQCINEYQFRAGQNQVDKDGFIKAQSDDVWQALELGVNPIRHVRAVAESQQLITFKRENRRGGGLLYRIEAAHLLRTVGTIQLTDYCDGTSFAANDGRVDSCVVDKNQTSLNFESPAGEDTFTKTQIKTCVSVKVSDLPAKNQPENNQKTSRYFVKNADQDLRFCESINSKTSRYFVKNADQDLRFCENTNKEVLNNTTSSIPSLVKEEAPLVSTAGGGGFEFIFPEKMLAQERSTAMHWINTFKLTAQQAQDVLDELTGQMQRAQDLQKPIASPLAYFKTLAEKSQQQTLVLAFAHQVQMQRSIQAAYAAKIANPVGVAVVTKTEEELALEKLAAEEARAKLRSMLGSRRKGGAA